MQDTTFADITQCTLLVIILAQFVIFGIMLNQEIWKKKLNIILCGNKIRVLLVFRGQGIESRALEN
jgi:hypothetical protein